MKLPPALSWMHLFARDASFICDDSTPPWMRAQIADIQTATPSPGTPGEGGGEGPWTTHNSQRTTHKSPHPNPLPEYRARGQEGGRALVTGGDFARDCAFVGINSAVTEKQLHAAGFGYVRRFAVLPDLQTARWFVPLDSPAVSTAAFSLYSPARFSARMKVAAAKIAAYSRLPLWYRDQIIIAQHTAAPIEKKMAELFGGAQVRLALSSGAPEPARNRKVSAAVIDTRGRIVGFAKIAGSELSLRLLRDESRALPEMSRRNIGAPELLFAGDVDGTLVTLQKPLSGKSVTPKMTPSKLALLASLRSSRLQFASESNMVATLPQRIDALPIERGVLRDALDEISPTLDQMRVPSTIVHGDFAPWNLREHDGKTVAFDWEYAELDGLPLFDQTHYALQVGYLLDNWNLTRACAFLGRMHEENDLGLSADQVRALHAVYLIDNLTRLFAEGYDENTNDMVGWYCRLLRQLLPARKEVVSV